MKHILNLPFTALVCGALLWAACGRDPGTETERVNDQLSENKKEMAKADDSEEWMDERNEAVKELNDLRHNMNERLEKEQKRLADGIKDAERRQECEQHISELRANILRIDTQLNRLNAGTSNDWQRLKAETRNMADSTSNWFKREAEKIDRKTDADADNDGH